jgi:hypothetical protein
MIGWTNPRPRGAALPPEEPELHPEEQRRKELDGSMPTHPPAFKPGDEKKIVGDGQVVHGTEYNQPPPDGARKSTGDALDPVGGPGLGMPPSEDGVGAAQRDRDTRVDETGNRPEDKAKP